MKGCAGNCLVLLLVYVGLLGGIVYWLQVVHAIPPEDSLGVSATAAGFGWLGAAFLYGVGQPLREHAAVRAGMTGERPRDGRITAVVGRIDSLGERLRAPLSGADCLAYKYEISRRIRGHKSSYLDTLYQGVALVPAMITATGFTCRLLAVPEFDFAAEPLEPHSAAQHAARHIATTAFQQPGDLKFSTYVAMQSIDDDGSYCWEENHAEKKEFDLATSEFTEHHVKNGEMVCVMGLYSAERRGLVPHPNWAKPVRVMRGDGQAIGKALRARAVKYALGGIAFAAAAVGLVALFVTSPESF
jgi:hypothetical protein